jgi:hypothetical protein
MSYEMRKAIDQAARQTCRDVVNSIGMTYDCISRLFVYVGNFMGRFGQYSRENFALRLRYVQQWLGTLPGHEPELIRSSVHDNMRGVIRFHIPARYNCKSYQRKALRLEESHAIKCTIFSGPLLVIQSLLG